jgi:RIO-like serine/threonine protein kinase
MLVQGEHWDETRQEHRDLASELVSALSAIHAKGVLHGDVHDGNILITPDGRIVMLDFAGAEVQAPASETDAEMCYLCNILT